jgi:hypothetical protein
MLEGVKKKKACPQSGMVVHTYNIIPTLGRQRQEDGEI